MQGRIKWFNNAKGYGFIGRDDGPDVFVHYTAITGEGYRSLQEGDVVGVRDCRGPEGPPSGQRDQGRLTWADHFATQLPAYSPWAALLRVYPRFSLFFPLR